MPKAKSPIKANLFLVIFLPAVMVFDLIYYFYTRSSCLNCGNVLEFFRDSSLSVFLVNEVVKLFRKA